MARTLPIAHRSIDSSRNGGQRKLDTIRLCRTVGPVFSFIETRLFTRLVREYRIPRTQRMTFRSMCFDKFAKRGKMARKSRNIGAEVLQGLREIKRGQYARVINVPDVAQIREKTGLSQARFAQLLGVSVRTLQDWEQGRRAPSGAARTLLMIAARNPQALLEVA
jgi:putative transcriptional regulator